MKDRHILGVSSEGGFFGREGELDYIIKRALDPIDPAPFILLTGGRWIGKSEILKRIYHRLFREQGAVVPFYFRFRDYKDTLAFSGDYLKTFLRQYAAFIKQDPAVAREELLLDDVERLIVECPIPEAERFMARHRAALRSGDALSAFKNAVGAPALISTSRGDTFFLILDDLHLLERPPVSDEVAGVAAAFMELSISPRLRMLASMPGGKIPEVFSAFEHVETMELKGLDTEASTALMSEMCRHYGIAFDSSILGFVSSRLGGNPMYMKSMVRAARRRAKGLETLKDFSDLYTCELKDGSIAMALRSIVTSGGYHGLRVLKELIGRGGPVRKELLTERLGISRCDMARISESLSDSGLVESGSLSLQWRGSTVEEDFVNLVYETDVRGGQRDEVLARIARDILVDGYMYEGQSVRGDLFSEVMELLRAFNGQKVLEVLLRNSDFLKRGIGPTPDPEGVKEIRLPQVVGTFDTGGMEGNETGPRIITARAFQDFRYDAGHEVLWMVGVKGAGPKVHLGDVESFLRRTGMLKRRFKTTRVVRCMVCRDGFTDEALSKMDEQGIFSLDAAQLDILKEIVSTKGAPSDRGAPSTVKEYLVVLPMSMKAELVAARAVEEIGAEIGFDDDAIAEIKTALVEACINAFEHSGSKGGRVRLRFVARDDGLVVYIENSGRGFQGLPTRGGPSGGVLGRPDKRGWGLELMKRLMDEVRFEAIKDGTKIVMVKYLRKRSAEQDEKEPR